MTCLGFRRKSQASGLEEPHSRSYAPPAAAPCLLPGLVWPPASGPAFQPSLSHHGLSPGDTPCAEARRERPLWLPVLDDAGSEVNKTQASSLHGQGRRRSRAGWPAPQQAHTDALGPGGWGAQGRRDVCPPPVHLALRGTREEEPDPPLHSGGPRQADAPAPGRGLGQSQEQTPRGRGTQDPVSEASARAHSVNCNPTWLRPIPARCPPGTSTREGTQV